MSCDHNQPENHEYANLILHYYFVFKLQVFQIKNILSERLSSDQNVGEFVHFNVFQSQTPSKGIVKCVNNASGYMVK